MNDKPTPSVRLWHSSLRQSQSMMAQGTLQPFPKHLIDSALDSPVFSIEIPDLAPIPLTTGPLICIDPDKGENLMKFLIDGRIAQYVRFRGPIKFDQRNNPLPETEVHYRLEWWLSGKPTEPQDAKLQAIPGGPLRWKTQASLEKAVKQDLGERETPVQEETPPEAPLENSPNVANDRDTWMSQNSEHVDKTKSDQGPDSYRAPAL